MAAPMLVKMQVMFHSYVISFRSFLGSTFDGRAQNFLLSKRELYDSVFMLFRFIHLLWPCSIYDLTF